MEYFKNPAVSKSDLDLFEQSFKHYLFFKQNPEPPTPEMKFGSLFHAVALGQNPHIHVTQKGKTSNEFKELTAEFGDIENHFIITQEENDKLNKMVDGLNRCAFWTNRPAGVYELEFYFKYEPHSYGFIPSEMEMLRATDCRIKTDYFSDCNFIVDLKTTSDITDKGLQGSIINYRYYRQSKFYRLGVQQSTGFDLPFYFVFIEKKAPYSTRVVQLDDLFDDVAGQQLDNLILSLQKLKKQALEQFGTEFPNYELIKAYDDAPETIYKPAWF